MSIPCLELAAAVVAVKLNCLTRNELEYPIRDTINWMDSTVVLQYTMNPHHISGDTLTPVLTLPTLRPEGRKVLNFTRWSCGFTAQSFCGRTRNIGLTNRPSCRNCLKMTVNAENALVEQTRSSAVKCWNRCCPAIHPGTVFERP